MEDNYYTIRRGKYPVKGESKQSWPCRTVKNYMYETTSEVPRQLAMYEIELFKKLVRSAVYIG